MAKPDPAGPISHSKANLVKCFRAAAELPAFMNEATADAAVARVHLDKIAILPDGSETIHVDQMRNHRPFICIWTSRQAGLRITSRSQGNEQCNGSIHVYGETDTSQAIVRYPDLDPQDESHLDAWWCNSVGLLLHQTFQAADLDGLMILSGTSNVGLWRCNPSRSQTMGDYYAFHTVFSWGMAR